MVRKADDMAIVAAIAEITERNGYPPTFRELAAAVGLKSTNTIFARLQRMRYKKLVEYNDGMPRTLRLTEKGRNLADQRA